jgi:hypothetical protein
MTSPPAVTTKSGADGSDGMLLIVMDNDGAFLPIRSVSDVKQNLENLRRNYYAPIRRGSSGIT